MDPKTSPNASTTVFVPGTFTGETVTWAISDALLSDVRHHHGKDVPNHIHEAAYFSVLLEGSYFETAPDFTVAYEPYTLVFHAAGTEHSDTIGPLGCRMFFVELLSRWTDVIEQLGDSPVHLFELHGGEPLWLVLQLHREFLFRDAGAETTIESLLLELCCYAALTTEDDASEPAWIASVENLLRARFRSHPMIAEIAEQIGVHPGHLCKAFRRFRGRSLGDCIRGLRVQFVCRRLLETKDPLDEIALEAGFTDQSHMTRMFKRLTGHSPGSYRQHMH